MTIMAPQNRPQKQKTKSLKLNVISGVELNVCGKESDVYLILAKVGSWRNLILVSLVRLNGKA